MSILDKLSGKKAKEMKTARGGAVSGEAKAAKPAAAKDDAKAESKKTEVTRGPLARENGGDSYRILLKPIMTEKTAMQQALSNQYTFSVATGATKVDVARAIKDLYGVKPAQIRMIVSEGKAVRFGRSKGREKDSKKAVVTLKQGDAISTL